MVQKKSVVLLSSGLDSTYNLWVEGQLGNIALVLTFNYGQRSAEQEIFFARKQCVKLNVEHRVVDLPWFSDLSASALLDRGKKIPQFGEVSIDDLAQSQKTARAVWVPNRNGIFLNIAAGYAEKQGAQWVVPGFNLEEAQTFPDNSEGFMQALDHSFRFSTANNVQVRCHSSNLTKPQIVEKMTEKRLPLDLIWSCYYGDSEPCGGCESCLRFLRAVRRVEGAKDRLHDGYRRFI